MLGQGIETAPSLPGAPLAERLVLEQPVGAMLVIALVGVIAASGLNRAGRARSAGVSVIGATGLAIAVFVAGQLVETPREAMRAATDRFVEAVRAGDTARLDAMVSDRLVLASSGRPSSTGSKAWVIDVAPGVAARVGEVSVNHRGAEMTARNAGRTRVNISASGGEGRLQSTWDLHWHRSERGEWSLTQLNALILMARRVDSDWWVRAAR